MDFAKMRNRIIFLKPCNGFKNSVDENIVRWFPFQPVTKDIGDDLSVSADNHISWKKGILQSTNSSISHYAVWAEVRPTTGREYDEAQKLRAETTYKICTRYFSDILPNMKILYGLKILKIESVLNLNEHNVELQIVASEIDTNGKEC